MGPLPHVIHDDRHGPRVTSDTVFGAVANISRLLADPRLSPSLRGLAPVPCSRRDAAASNGRPVHAFRLGRLAPSRRFEE